MIPPFVACMVLVAMLSYLGLHVIAREVIFVDLSLAQMAALGGLSALLISFHPEEAERLGWKIRWWDFLFYLSFGVVITLAVPVAGVLMVFSFLVVPAVIAFLFTRDMRRLAYISWGSGALASLLGLWVSYKADLPTGPLIVCIYGLLLALAWVVRRVKAA